MTEAKHTPGPWMIIHSYNIVAENGRRGIASTGGYQNNQKTEAVHAENCANARLIAAAPELLAALQAGYDDLRTRLTQHAQSAFGTSYDSAAKHTDSAFPVLEQMRAAIARATGSEVEK